MPAVIMALLGAAVSRPGVVVQYSSDQTWLVELTVLAQRLQYADPDPIAGDCCSLCPAGRFAGSPSLPLLFPWANRLPLGVWLLAGRALSPVEWFYCRAPAEQAALLRTYINASGDAWRWFLRANWHDHDAYPYHRPNWLRLAGAWSQRRHLRLGILF
jgi:hypothetical protein